MTGFVALYRQATDHHLFSGDAGRLGAWCWLISNACWRPTRFVVSGATVTIERGQVCASRAQLAKAWGWSPSAVERFLARLLTEQMIERETGQGRSIITICNYDTYQDLGDPAGQATGQATGPRSDRRRTAKEQGNKGTMVDEEAEASPSTARPSDFPRPEFASPEVWADFLRNRKAKRLPSTASAHAKLLRDVASAVERTGWPPGQVFQACVEQGWGAIYDTPEMRAATSEKGNGNDWSGSARNRGGPDRRDGFERACDDAFAGYRTRQPRSTGTTRDAMRRALELTDGAGVGGSDGSEGSDARTDEMPHPMRPIRDVRG